MKSKDVYDLLKAKKNVTGVRWGKMYKKDGTYRGMGWVVTVGKKKMMSKLTKADIVPEKMPDNAETDVIEAPEFKALNIADHQRRHRPFPCGVSIGHVDITAGTAGLIVSRDGADFVLSNNHVLADVNEADVGDPIVQPGIHDGGQQGADTVAFLEEFEPIVMLGEPDTDCTVTETLIKALNFLYTKMGSGLQFKAERNATNLVDCAIARLDTNQADLYRRQMLNLGKVLVIDHAQVDEEVVKSGRTTGVTKGTVVSTDATSTVNMGSGVAVFTDQIIIEGDGFSAGGDSGSAILKLLAETDYAVVGLLFAGNGQQTIANKIHNVFDTLRISL